MTLFMSRRVRNCRRYYYYYYSIHLKNASVLDPILLECLAEPSLVIAARLVDRNFRRRLLRSTWSTPLDVRRTRLSTVGDRAFSVAAARLRKSFHRTSLLLPLSVGLSIFLCRPKSHLLLISLPDTSLISTVPEQWVDRQKFVILNTKLTFVITFMHIHSFILTV